MGLRTPVASAHDYRTLGELAADPAVSALWSVPAKTGSDPVANAQASLHGSFNGRSPADWTRVASPARLAALGAPAPAAHADLAAQVGRLDALAGHPADAADLAARAAAVPADVRGPFADLVKAVADAYEGQLPIAKDVKARVSDPLTSRAPLLTAEQRDAMVARADGLVAAMNAFRQAVPAFPRTSTPIFKDPFGFVILGSTGDDTYSGQDPILVVDPAGNDHYNVRTAAACPDLTDEFAVCNGLAVAVALDLAGNDVYTYNGAPSLAQGAGILGGLGVLYDVAGDDQYHSTMTRSSGFPFFQYVDGGAQGFGEAGYGLLLDTGGNDVYDLNVQSTGESIWEFGQGFGGLGGVGISADAGGWDQWLSHGLGIPNGAGFEGIYTDGTGFYGGTGVLVDQGGAADTYYADDEGVTTDFYAMGFGAFAGLGVMVDDGGNDEYEVTDHATNPWINPLLNCEYGTGSLGGAGVFLDLGGDDWYEGTSISPYQAHTMNEGFGGIGAAYGLFIDVGGNDHHEMNANGAGGSVMQGRGVLAGGSTLIDINGYGGNVVGDYLDVGGADTYIGGPSQAQDNAVWVAGADVNTPLDLNLNLW